MKNKWIRFDKEQPKLLDDIQIRLSIDKVLNFGRIISMRSGGNWFIGRTNFILQSEYYSEIVVRGDDLWRTS